MTNELDPEQIEVRLVLQAIYERYGYDLRGYVADSMHRRVLAVMKQHDLRHLGELSHRLLTEPEFFTAVLDDLMVQVSDMFRDPAFYVCFRRQVVPVLRTYPQLKIWHAGCATGEEVYTTAILLHEEGLYDRTQIYATDLSMGALARAREAVYTEEQLERFAANYRQAGGRANFEDYFTRGYGNVTVRATLRSNVVFFQHDLGIDHVPGEMHVVFCRNVLIYFGERLRSRAMALFAESLCLGGFLCLGPSEALGPAASAQFSTIAARERLFQRREWTGPATP